MNFKMNKSHCPAPIAKNPPLNLTKLNSCQKLVSWVKLIPSTLTFFFPRVVVVVVVVVAAVVVAAVVVVVVVAVVIVVVAVVVVIQGI